MQGIIGWLDRLIWWQNVLFSLSFGFVLLVDLSVIGNVFLLNFERKSTKVKTMPTEDDLRRRDEENAQRALLHFSTRKHP